MQSKFIKNIKLYWQLYLFLLLPLAYILIFSYYPMTGVQIAFKKFDYKLGIWGSPWVGFPAIIITAIVSPIARPTPSTTADRMPDLAAGRVALKMVCIFEAPSPREASL